MIYVLYREESLQAPCGKVALVLTKGWAAPVWNKNISRRGSIGNVGIPKGFPGGVGRVESQLFGFPCFPHLGISNALFHVECERTNDEMCFSRYLPA